MSMDPLTVRISDWRVELPTLTARHVTLRELVAQDLGPLVDLLSLSDSTRFGLGANVYTRDLKNILRCMRELKAGTVWINDPLTDNDAGPFGGFKQSGLGRELGMQAMEGYSEIKSVFFSTD
jgi:acyl-CoA reductase-like NAD-dependent aldehyde dehydrogenase